MSKVDDGGPAFPCGVPMLNGMSLRVWLAAHAPQPTPQSVQQVGEQERQANPHGDSYKPARHSALEIEVMLRYQWADEMLAQQGRAW